MASLLPGIISGGIGLLGGLFGGGGGAAELSPEQRRLMDEALRQTKELYGMTRPLRELGVEQLQEPLAARPDLSAAFFDPGNPYNRVPLPAISAGTPLASSPGARNPILPAVSQQLNQPNVMPLLPAPPAPGGPITEPGPPNPPTVGAPPGEGWRQLGTGLYRRKNPETGKVERFLTSAYSGGAFGDRPRGVVFGRGD